MSDILKAVARAICRAGCEIKDCPCHYANGDQEIKEADAAITAFLKAAAERDWRMRRIEPTADMKRVGDEAVSEEKPAHYIYRAMNAAGPEFELDKE